MQLDLAMEKELSHDSRIEIVSSEPRQTGSAVISSRFPLSDIRQSQTRTGDVIAAGSKEDLP